MHWDFSHGRALFIGWEYGEGRILASVKDVGRWDLYCYFFSVTYVWDARKRCQDCREVNTCQTWVTCFLRKAEDWAPNCGRYRRKWWKWWVAK